MRSRAMRPSSGEDQLRVCALGPYDTKGRSILRVRAGTNRAGGIARDEMRRPAPLHRVHRRVGNERLEHVDATLRTASGRIGKDWHAKSRRVTPAAGRRHLLHNVEAIPEITLPEYGVALQRQAGRKVSRRASDYLLHYHIGVRVSRRASDYHIGMQVSRRASDYRIGMRVPSTGWASEGARAFLNARYRIIAATRSIVARGKCLMKGSVSTACDTGGGCPAGNGACDARPWGQRVRGYFSVPPRTVWMFQDSSGLSVLGDLGFLASLVVRASSDSASARTI